MKRRIIFILLVGLLFTSQAKAQDVSTSVVKIGPKIGLNISSLRGTQDYESASAKIGGNIGAVINIRWGQRYLDSDLGTGYIGFQQEMLFSTQGALIDGKPLKLNYFMVPMLLEFYPTEKINVELGPEFAFMMSRPNTITQEQFTYDLKDLCSGKDIALVIGLGYEVKNGLSINARYNMGLSKLANNLPWKNNVLQISLCWLLTL